MSSREPYAKDRATEAPELNVLASLERSWMTQVLTSSRSAREKIIAVAGILHSEQKVDFSPDISFRPGREALESLLRALSDKALRELVSECRPLPPAERSPQLAYIANAFAPVVAVIPDFLRALDAALAREDGYLEKIVPGKSYFTKVPLQRQFNHPSGMAQDKGKTGRYLFDMNPGNVATVSSYDIDKEEVVVTFHGKSETFKRDDFLLTFDPNRREGEGDLAKMGKERVVTTMNAVRQGKWEQISGRKSKREVPKDIGDAAFARVMAVYEQHAE